MEKDVFVRLGLELESCQASSGLTMADVLELPKPLRAVVQWMMRQVAAPAAEIAAQMGGDENAVRDLLAPLIEKGNVIQYRVEGKTSFAVWLARKRKREMPANLWQALDDKVK